MANITQEGNDLNYYTNKSNESNIPIKKSPDTFYKNKPLEVTGLRPDYYGGQYNVYEVFKVLEAWELDKDFYLGNVIKYLARAGKKTFNNKEDLEKALVYLQRRIDTL
jgi:hypothetical protein